MSEKMIKVGFIGLGRIGKPMAVNVLEAGYDLTVYDLRKEPMSELASVGARAAESPGEIAEKADLIEIAVVDDLQVEELLIGDHGLIGGGRAGSIVAIHSTVGPETVRRLAAIGRDRGVHVIDAPVSGGEAGARGKSLCYMVGGDPAHLQRAKRCSRKQSSTCSSGSI